MAVKRFHWTEIAGGLVGVLIVSAIKQPTPVLFAIVGFLVGQVVVRTIRNSRLKPKNNV
jgi:xanthosine utilization system XapX-like protein